MRPTRDTYYLLMLELVAGRSTCGRRSVGAIITDNTGHILSTGYNGVPRDFKHCIDIPCPGRLDQPGDTSRCMAVHAEINAIMQCSRLDLAFTLYVSCAPCFVCAKAICNTNIKRVVCSEKYADSEGVRLLRAQGMQIIISNRGEV